MGPEQLSDQLSNSIKTQFVGERGMLFRIALQSSILTVLTLGIYRFWMKTRLRRYYWSSIRPGGSPLEYVGEPIEKLLGFLIAVVVMAFYLGVINLVLMFASFSLFQSNAAAYLASFAGVVPLWFLATYRARRYTLARTRWRGLGFSLDPGAGGYALRGLFHWALTILSLGLLWPRMKFHLEKYRTDRTWFGDHKLEQGGTWTMLFPSAVPSIIAVLMVVGPLLVLTALPMLVEFEELPGWLEASFAYLALSGLGLLLLPFCLIYTHVRTFQLLTNHKTVQGIGFEFDPSGARVTRIMILGNLLAYGVVVAALVAISVVTFAGAEGQDIYVLAEMGQIPGWVAMSALLLSYFFVYIVWGVLRHVFVTQPIWKHYAESFRITGAPYLVRIRRRVIEEHGEAEGFAEALDLGAAI
jgi:uncharacterized membrane protein YjgN (DUF898 family)